MEPASKNRGGHVHTERVSDMVKRGDHRSDRTHLHFLDELLLGLRFLPAFDRVCTLIQRGLRLPGTAAGPIAVRRGLVMVAIVLQVELSLVAPATRRLVLRRSLLRLFLLVLAAALLPTLLRHATAIERVEPRFARLCPDGGADWAELACVRRRQCDALFSSSSPCGLFFPRIPIPAHFDGQRFSTRTWCRIGRESSHWYTFTMTGQAGVT